MQEGLLHRLGIHALAHGGIQRKEERIQAGLIVAAGGGGQLRLHQSPVEAGAARLAAPEGEHGLATREDGVHDGEGHEIRVRRGRRMVGEMDAGRGARHAQVHAALAALGRLGADGRIRRGAGRDAPKALLHQAPVGPRIDIARQHQHGVVGHIEPAIVGVQIVASDAQQVILPADGLVVIGMLAERRGGHLLHQDGEGVVLLTLALGHDHCALDLDVLWVEQGPAHAVGLEIQGEMGAVAGEGAVVGGIVLAGHGIDITAVAGHQAHDAALRVTLRPLEEHVLDPVGEAGQSVHLVAAANAVPEPGAHHRGGVALLQDHLETVVEHELLCMRRHAFPLVLQRCEMRAV